jgi:hypothetical protein
LAIVEGVIKRSGSGSWIIDEAWRARRN